MLQFSTFIYRFYKLALPEMTFDFLSYNIENSENKSIKNNLKIHEYS